MSSRSSSSQFRPLIIPQHTDCLLTLTYAHCKTRDVFALLPHNDRTKFTRCISCPTHSHNFQPKKFFSFQTMYIARKHKLDFHRMLRKTPASQCCLFFLSLSLSLSWILLQQSLGQILGATESSSLHQALQRLTEHLFTLFFLGLLPQPPHALLPPTLFYSPPLCSDLPKIILLIFFHATKTSVGFLLKLFENLPTSFHPSPTAYRHCLLLLINSAPYLLTISNRQFSWTTQHAPTKTKQPMQLHAWVNGAPQWDDGWSGNLNLKISQRLDLHDDLISLYNISPKLVTKISMLINKCFFCVL